MYVFVFRSSLWYPTARPEGSGREGVCVCVSVHMHVAFAWRVVAAHMWRCVVDSLGYLCVLLPRGVLVCCVPICFRLAVASVAALDVSGLATFFPAVLSAQGLCVIGLGRELHATLVIRFCGTVGSGGVLCHNSLPFWRRAGLPLACSVLACVLWRWCVLRCRVAPFPPLRAFVPHTMLFSVVMKVQGVCGG